MDINIGIDNDKLVRQLGCGFKLVVILGLYGVIVAWLRHYLDNSQAGHILTRFLAYILGIGTGFITQPIITDGLFNIDGDNTRTAVLFGSIAVSVWIANRIVPDSGTGGTSTKGTGI